MARSRNIKPGVFTNELLGTLPPEVTLLFMGLWCLADKDGILEDLPLRIKAEIFPYRDNLDVNGYLTVMEQKGFIQRYSVDGKKYIFVIEFAKHQSPHHTEKARGYPQPPKLRVVVTSPLTDGESQVRSRSDSLIPDSLIHGFTDSLIPDSIDSKPKSKPLKPASPVSTKKMSADETALQTACKETWKAYSIEYQNRYKVEPIRNASVNSQIKGFCGRVAHNEAPHIAGFYVWHNQSFYVTQMHPTSLLLKDAEKLRTEWATNTKATTSQARLADQTQGMGQIWDKLKREAQENERTIHQNN